MSSVDLRAPVVLRELGRRLGVAAALSVALVSLFQHAPLLVACARGAATLLVLGLGTRLGAAALERTLECDRDHAEPKKEGRS